MLVSPGPALSCGLISVCDCYWPHSVSSLICLCCLVFSFSVFIFSEPQFICISVVVTFLLNVVYSCQLSPVFVLVLWGGFQLNLYTSDISSFVIKFSFASVLCIGRFLGLLLRSYYKLTSSFSKHALLNVYFLLYIIYMFCHSSQPGICCLLIL